MEHEIPSKKLIWFQKKEDGNSENENNTQVFQDKPLTVGCPAAENPPNVVLDNDASMSPEQCVVSYKCWDCLQVVVSPKRKFKCYFSVEPIAWNILEVPEFMTGNSRFEVKRVNETEAEIIWSPLDESKHEVLCKWNLNTCLLLGSTTKTQEAISASYKSWVDPLPIILQRTPEEDKLIPRECVMIRYYENNIELLCLSKTRPLFHVMPERPILIHPKRLVAVGLRSFIYTPAD